MTETTEFGTPMYQVDQATLYGIIRASSFDPEIVINNKPTSIHIKKIDGSFGGYMNDTNAQYYRTNIFHADEFLCIYYIKPSHTHKFIARCDCGEEKVV